MRLVLLAKTIPFLDQLDLEQLKANAAAFFVRYAPDIARNVLFALVILVVGKWVAGQISRILEKFLRRARLDETLSKFLCRIAHSIILIVVVMAALERLGFNTTSFAAILAATGLAVGMALQGSLSNFAAGVMIILFRPFKVGDFVHAGGEKGIIEEIHIFNTHMRTPDNVEVIIPNGAVTGSSILNYSSKPTRRIDLVVGCGYSDDLRAVKRFLEDLVTDDPRILTDPEPVVAVDELADNSVNFVVRPWVPSVDYWPVRWDLIEKLKIGFDDRGFSIPFPQREMHIVPSAADAGAPTLGLHDPPGAQENGGALFVQRPAA
jgi:small conductance mechanosensitive channel